MVKSEELFILDLEIIWGVVGFLWLLYVKLECYFSVHWYCNSLRDNLMGNYNRDTPLNGTINGIYSAEPSSV